MFLAGWSARRIGRHVSTSREVSCTRFRIGLGLLFLAAGLFVFLLGLTFVPVIPENLLLATQILVLLVPGLAAIGFRIGRPLRAYWDVMYAYFVAACALVVAGFAGDWVLLLSGEPLETPGGLTALKLGEDIAIVATVVALILLIRRKPDSLFLSQGRLGLGLGVGLLSFVGLAALGLAFAAAQGLTSGRIFNVLPLYAAVVIADGFMEELLFRGLFLKRLGQVIGPQWANVVTAAVFSLAHLQVGFTPSVPAFLVVVFVLGLLWGWMMQRTGSLLASALFHAGADMLIIASFFASYGVQT